MYRYQNQIVYCYDRIGENSGMEIYEGREFEMVYPTKFPKLQYSTMLDTVEGTEINLQNHQKKG